MPVQRPILIFDSGLGGLPVAQAIRTRCPGQPLIYVADTAGGAYGTKSPQLIARRATAVIRHVAAEHDPCHVVVACNTTSAVALDALRDAMPTLSVSGVIEPGARAVSSAAGEKTRPVLGVLATSATLRSRAFHMALGKRRMRSQILLRPAPLLIAMVEEGRTASDPLVRAAVREYTRPLRHAGIDVLLLGCGHFSVYRQTFERYMRSAVVVDSATACAEDLARRLCSDAPAVALGTELACYVTDDPDRFRRLARRVCSLRVGTPHLLDDAHIQSVTSHEHLASVPLRVAG